MSEDTIIVTSNNQITCTTNLICEASGLDIPEGWVFDNGTVLMIEGLGETSKIKMIHPTQVSNPSRFISPEKFNEKFKDDLPIPMKNNKNVFIARHGLAGHNEPDADMTQAHDARLTSMGIEQAQNSGIAIYKNCKGRITKALTSDLIRTIDTLEIMTRQFPEDNRPKKCEVCIQARENSRLIGGKHHWQRSNPLREYAIDPFISIDKLRLLAPDKLDSQLERMVIENTPKNDPIGDWDGCLKKLNDLEIDWSLYKSTLQKGYAEKKTFGKIASEKTLFDIIFEQ